MVGQKLQDNVEKFKLSMAEGFKKKTVPGHMVVLNWVSVAMWYSYWPLLIPESPSVFFPMPPDFFFLSRLSLISYACKDIDTKLSTGVAEIRFLLMQITTIPCHRDLSVYADCRYYCLLFKSSSCNTSLLFPCSPCTARLYCFPVP